jgi:hypothetical protein
MASPSGRSTSGATGPIFCRDNMVGGNQQFVREQEYQASGLRPVGILSKLECRNVWPSPVPQQALLDDTSRLAAARMRESGYVMNTTSNTTSFGHTTQNGVGVSHLMHILVESLRGKRGCIQNLSANVAPDFEVHPESENPPSSPCGCQT